MSKEVKAPVVYAIHAAARSRFNRVERAKLPQKPKMKTYVGGDQQRLVRSRPLYMQEDKFMKNLEALKAQAARHEIEVRTPDGRLIDLSTLSSPKAVTPPLPNFRADSVENDKRFPTPEGWTTPLPPSMDLLFMPQVVASGDKPALLKTQENEDDQ